MATFSVNDTLRRAILTGNGSTTSFAFSFQVNEISDIKVYVDGVLKTQGTGSANYAVQNGSGGAGLSNTGTGSVVFVTAPSNATTVTILSDIPLARTSLYTSGGNVTASSLENDFDTITMALGDREERDARSLQAPVQDPTSVDMTLPAKADRLGKLLGFNSSTGNPEATFSVTDATSLTTISSNISSLGGITADITTLAHLQDGTTATNALSNLNTKANDISAVANIHGNVTTVANNLTAINNASDNATKAQNYATKVDGVVPSTSDFSAKAQAVGGTGVTDVSGSAKEWALGGGTNPSATVHVNTGDEYSAKGYAVGAIDRGSNTGKHSAKDWATYTAGTVDGTLFSAKYYAQQAETNATDFSNVYQGTHSSDPSGGTVSAGDLYYNSTSQSLKYYNGSAWVAIEAVDTSTFSTKGFATAMAVAL
tara:strand:- start:453 stop:1733 length:1281 start_codon:yes stop_codon:yes gene_type:complete